MSKLFLSLKERIPSLLHNKNIRNGGLYTIFAFAGRGFSFIMLMIVSAYIAPDEYGNLSLFNTCVQVCGFFMGLSSAGYLSVSFFKSDKDSFHKDLGTIFSLYVITALLTLGIVWIIKGKMSNWLGIPPAMFWLVVVISFFSSLYQILLDYQRVKENVWRYGIITMLFVIIYFSLTLYFVVPKQLSWKGVVFANTTASVTLGIFAIGFLFRNRLLSFSLSMDRIKSILSWSLPLIPHLATVWICNGCDQYIIKYFYSTYEVGIFSFALNLSSVIAMVGTAFNQTYSVNLYQILSSGRKEEIIQRTNRQKKILYYINVASMILITVFLSILVTFFLPNYTPSLPYFYILVVFAFLQCVYLIYCNYLFYYGATQKLMLITFGSSLVHLLLSIWLTRYSLYLTAVIYIAVQIGIVVLIARESKILLERNTKEI